MVNLTAKASQGSGSLFATEGDAQQKADVEGKLSRKRIFHRKKCGRGDACDCSRTRGGCFVRVKIVVDFVEAGEHHTVNLFQGDRRANATNWTRVKTLPNSVWSAFTVHLRDAKEHELMQGELAACRTMYRGVAKARIAVQKRANFRSTRTKSHRLLYTAIAARAVTGLRTARTG